MHMTWLLASIVGGVLGCAWRLLRVLGDELEPLRSWIGGSEALPVGPADGLAPGRAGAPRGGQPDVTGTKYELGPARRSGEEDRGHLAPRYAGNEVGELPAAYGADRMVLLPRDPHWLYVYWEVTPGTRIRAVRELGPEAEGAREVLRVHEVTNPPARGDDAGVSFDVELPPGAESWYVNVPKAAATYRVEVALRAASGRHLTLVSSNAASTPRCTLAPEGEPRWVRLGRPGTAQEAGTPGHAAADLAAEAEGYLGGPRAVSSDALAGQAGRGTEHPYPRPHWWQ